MSVFDEPSSGSVHRMYFPCAPVWMCLISSSSSDAMAATRPVASNASTTTSFEYTSSFFCASPVALRSPTRPNSPTSAARRISRTSALPVYPSCAISVESSPATAGLRAPSSRMWRLNVMGTALILLSLGRGLFVHLGCAARLAMERSIEPAPKLAIEQRAPRGSEQRRIVVQNHAHRHLFEHLPQTPFRQKRFHKARLAQLRQNLGRDASADEQSARGHELQRQVPRFRPVHRNEEVQRRHAELALIFKRRARNHGRRVVLFHRLAQPGLFRAAPRIAQKLVDVSHAGTRKDPLPAHVPAEPLAQVHQQRVFDFVPRREVRMSALARQRAMLRAVPVQSGFA